MWTLNIFTPAEIMRLHRLSIGRMDSVLCWLRCILASFHLYSVVVVFFTESVHLNLEMNDTETDEDDVWVCLSELQLLLVISTSHISKTFILI